MFYFIPSWYSENRQWYDPTTVFFRETLNREFDDTIHQIRIFNKSNEKLAIMLLNYFPNFRYFANRQNIRGIPYLSIFDQIQNVENATNKIIRVEDLIEDSDLEYIYTPFLLMIYKNQKIYAEVEYADEGYIMSMLMYSNGKIEKKYVFDDRGFLSSIIYYEDNNELYQEYLNFEGIWQIRQNLQNDTVEVNNNSDCKFNKSNYNSMGELIKEKLSQLIKDNSVVVFASNNVHNDIVINVNKNSKYVCSIFENRYDISNDNIDKFKNVDLFVVDSKNNRKLLEDNLGFTDKIHQITPYDTRLQLGKSQRKKELILYLLADGNDEKRLKKILISIFEMMIEDSKIELIIGTYNKDYNKNSLSNIINDIFIESFNDAFYYREEDSESENLLDEIEETRTELPIQIKVINNELTLIKTLEYVRLILNISKNPDMFTTIIGISSGIPQINVVENDYVENYKNGLIIDNIKNVKYAINYYFSSLDNWNKSLVFSVEKILKYTSDEIVNEWKDKLKE